MVVGIVVVVGVVGSNLRRHVRGLIPKSWGVFRSGVVEDVK